MASYTFPGELDTFLRANRYNRGWRLLLPVFMKRYLIDLIFGVAVVLIYHVVEINLFSFDFTRRVKNALFDLRNEPSIDTTVMLFNLGKLQPRELQERIDSLLLLGPRKIGVNLCHFDKIPSSLVTKYAHNSVVVFGGCETKGPNALSQVINEENVVTHFKTDNPDYFELKLTGFKGRGNDTERINYGHRVDYPAHRGDLTDSYYWFNPFMKDKTILVGYMGDYTTDSIYYFRDCRITPLNEYYGQDNLLPDMYDIEISFHIMRTINEHDFINDVGQIPRVFIILAFGLLNVAVLTYVRTRWILVNLIIASVLFVLLTIGASLLIVYGFDAGYFLDMDEVPMILATTTVFTVLLNIWEKGTDS